MRKYFSSLVNFSMEITIKMTTKLFLTLVSIFSNDIKGAEKKFYCHPYQIFLDESHDLNIMNNNDLRNESSINQQFLHPLG